MDKVISTIIIVAVLVVIYGGLALAWRARKRRQGGIGPLMVPPSELGSIHFRDELLYVATTRADSPLDRIVVAGLGFRARAFVTVADSGVVLTLAGADARFIPRSAITGAGRATWTIDRVVPNDGLVFLRWTLDGTALDTYFRSPDPAALVDALALFTPASKDLP
ncbi:MAG TPA: hypothetical protein VNT53_05760 [Pseudolysinimonas sp.]|nr:hypothetical protein [Pseudolysinimonas sp.]